MSLEVVIVVSDIREQTASGFSMPILVVDAWTCWILSSLTSSSVRGDT